MATKIKLTRLGKMREPHYRIVVADARAKRDGRAIETIGAYKPKEDPSFMEVDAERVAYWLGVGAQPTAAVAAILRVTGDWQKFRGEPAPAPMLVAAARADRHEAFAAAAAESAGIEDKPATTPRGSRPRKADAPAAAETPSETPAPDAAVAAAPTEEQKPAAGGGADATEA